MKQVLLIIGFALSFSSLAESPARSIELTEEVMDELGFRFEVVGLGDQNQFILTSPPKIEEYWVPVTVQSGLQDAAGNYTLSKVGVGEPVEEVVMSVFYKPNIGKLAVGVYYVCKRMVEQCRSGGTRLYQIGSIEKLPITKR